MPSTVIYPAVALKQPINILMRVDLPAPFSPKSDTISPL
jgi:hypothetical protein